MNSDCSDWVKLFSTTELCGLVLQRLPGPELLCSTPLNFDRLSLKSKSCTQSHVYVCINSLQLHFQLNEDTIVELVAISTKF